MAYLDFMNFIIVKSLWHVIEGVEEDDEKIIKLVKGQIKISYYYFKIVIMVQYLKYNLINL